VLFNMGWVTLLGEGPRSITPGGKDAGPAYRPVKGMSSKIRRWVKTTACTTWSWFRRQEGTRGLDKRVRPLSRGSPLRERAFQKNREVAWESNLLTGKKK